MSRNAHTYDRRTVLRGAGACLALPWLESAGPRPAEPRPPCAAWLYFPNGNPEGTWSPERTGDRGELLELDANMAALQPFRGDLVIPRGLHTPRGNGHGAGTATWLTGGEWDEEAIDAGGPSVDQVLAERIGQDSLLPSLELSLRGEGYFSKSLPRNAISWKTATRPAHREIDPRAVFDRMFRTGAGKTSDASVLDFVLEEARRLRRELGREDLPRVDEYLDAVRSVERRLEFASSDAIARRLEEVGPEGAQAPPAAIPEDHGEYLRLQLDLVFLAFWTGASRVATVVLDHGQSNRYVDFVGGGVKGTWHALSHWKDISGETEDDDGVTSWSSRKEKLAMYQKVVAWHHGHFAELLAKMGAAREGDARLLDRCLLVYGSSIADGHEHEERDLPVLLAGGRGLGVRAGREVRYRRPTDLTRLHFSILERMGAAQERFGGVSRGLSEIFG